MADLTPEQVQGQLDALGLRTVDEEDLSEVTHRINAFREALAALEPIDLDAQEPLPVFDSRVVGDEA
jgi:hypothetical protein